MRLDDQGRLVTGDPSDVSNWVGYGARVIAAADGVVVSALNDLENQVPGSLPDPNTITVGNVDGNHVVIDHGNGLYSFYAHLQPGSVQVQVGDTVQTGDQLGLLGNTGNTSAPHLHFHIMSGPSPLGSDGTLYVLDAFLLAGEADVDEAAFDAALIEGAASFPKREELNPVERERELPLDNAIVDFPGQ
jgi:murein DD-endopeptidase MepM/ murein hydrolase activator NlpD